MPLYEFDCQKCGQPFEELVRSASAIAEVTCPRCGSPKIKKKVSAFAARVAGGSSFGFGGGADCAPGST